MSIAIENPKYADSLFHILEATGAIVSMKEVVHDQTPASDAGH